MIEVSDDGHGMTPEILARIFDPFFTTKFTGRGLGLAAISGIVRSHGGALAVQSTPGAGTTFQVLFPPLKSASVKVAVPAPDLSWRATGRALLVDDDLSIRIAGGAVLRHLGFEVETAEDGVQGVEKATAPGADYRFVLLDLTMPKLNGHEAFAAIRKKLPTLPVLLMSGYSDQQATRLFELGGPRRLHSEALYARQPRRQTSPLARPAKRGGVGGARCQEPRAKSQVARRGEGARRRRGGGGEAAARRCVSRRDNRMLAPGRASPRATTRGESF